MAKTLKQNSLDDFIRQEQAVEDVQNMMDAGHEYEEEQEIVDIDGGEQEFIQDDDFFYEQNENKEKEYISLDGSQDDNVEVISEKE